MPKRINRALFFLFLVFGWTLVVSGCANDKPSIITQGDSLPLTSAAPTSQIPLAIINPSETSSESSSNPPSSSGVQKAQTQAQAVPILYYHSVMREVGNEVRMPPDQFEDQMAYLQDKGYQSISLDQFYQAEYFGETLPAKPIMITFDDGYADNYTTAFPILKKYGFTATIFMVSSYIDGEGFMTWPQLKELAANGWQIEGHTANHTDLTKLDSKTVLSELKSSKELLEKGLGQPVDFFAYPYGDFNAGVVLAVKNTGYVMAFTTERGWADHNADAWHVHRVYCYAFMGMTEFSRRLQNPNY